MERVQLREGALKHKTEVETLVLEHQAELDSVRAALEGQVTALQQQTADLQQRLEDTEGRLADAQVGNSDGTLCLYWILAVADMQTAHSGVVHGCQHGVQACRCRCLMTRAVAVHDCECC